jgi:hypothetical protein
MPNQSEGPIQLFDNSVPSINLALAQILERLDAVKGLRGDPTIYAATTVGAPGAQTQAARLADLPTEDPASVLFWLLQPRPLGPGSAPTSLTDNTGGSAGNTLAAVGGIVALTDNTTGTPGNTLAALGGTTVLTDSSGGSANNTIAAITQAANAGSADVGPVADGFADVAAKINVLINDVNDCRDNDSSLGAKVNALISDMNDVRDGLASLAAKVNALISEGKVAGVLL